MKQTEQAIPDDEILSVLNAADAGFLQIEPVGERNWMRQYCGIMEFKLSNGWELGVFNDCCEWDYIEWIKAPDGRRVDYVVRKYGADLFTASEALHWSPQNEDRWGEWDGEWTL